MAELRGLGLDSNGSISIDAVDSMISTDATRAALAAAGSPADAVIWEEVEARTSESADLSFSFLAFMVLATLIAAVGILTDSQILIIGAMVVGPEFGPLAGLCVALVQRRTELALRSATALAVGFPTAIVLTFLFVVLFVQPVRRLTPSQPRAVRPRSSSPTRARSPRWSRSSQASPGCCLSRRPSQAR